MSFLDGYGYEFQLDLRRAYNRTSLRRASRAQETSCELALIFKGQEGKKRGKPPRI